MNPRTTFPGRKALPALALSILLASCSASRAMTFASDPPGARVLVDGVDSGFSTPCVMHISQGDYRIDYVLPGYAPATRLLVRGSREEVIFWREGLAYFNTFAFPLFLNYRDFFVPIDLNRGPQPQRLFVRLQREADQ